MDCRIRLHFLLPVFFIFFGLALTCVFLPRPAGAGTLDTPTGMVSEPLTDWVLGESMLYWADRCPGGEFTGPGYLRRKPSSGGFSQTLATTDGTSCAQFGGMAITPEGLYYYSTYSGGAILFRSSAAPAAAPTTVYSTSQAPLEGSSLVVEDDYIYWISNQLSPTTLSRVHRVKKDGSGGYQKLYEASGAYAYSIDVVFGMVVWTDTSGLWRLYPCSSGTCTRYSLSSYPGRTISHYYTGLYGVELYWSDTDASPDKIKKASCTYSLSIYPLPPSLTCGSTTDFYTATTSSWYVGQARRAGSYVYWPEREPGTGPTDGRVRRVSSSGGTAQDIATNFRYLDDNLAVDSLYVYFANLSNDSSYYAGGIYRLPLDATAITRDLRADWFEVTQGVQNQGNSVPLVADKTTVVRGYGSQVTGPDSPGIDAVLYGTRGGTPLPGSPLASRNGTQNLQVGGARDRANLSQSWFFELPNSWTSAGSVLFRLEVDPHHVYPDSVPANNTTSQTLTFTAKAPVCNVFIPVRTNAPTPRTTDPNFNAWVDMAKRLWPTRAYWSYRQDSDVAELEACWALGFIPYPCYGPYELPDDSWKVLLALNTRDAFTDDPDECDAAGGYTHYIGMVHPSTDTGDTNGTGYMNRSAAWVKMPPHTPTSSTDFDWPRKGGTLAHELGHNANRKHVNCGGPDDPDGSYPYPTDQISFTGQSNYYGFDVRTQTVLAPDDVADLMGYCQPRWTSDYTWRAFYNWLDPGMKLRTSSAGYSLLSAAGWVYATGSVATAGGSGTLRYAYTYPTAAMSQGMRAKWAETAARAARQVATYTLQVKDAGSNVLSTQTLSLLQVSDYPADPSRAFVTVFSAPSSPAAKMELLENGVVLATLTMGTSVPTVTVSKPAAGETVDTTLTVEWQASDSNSSDILLYTIQYSPDNGTTWQILTTDYAGIPGSSQSLTISNPSIPASSGAGTARIRVLASDGFNTGMGQSAGFTVVNRKPEPHFLTPAPGETFAGGSNPVLRGMGFDLEDGALPGSSLTWKLLGVTVGTGEQMPAGGLQPGAYPLTLTATDSKGSSADATTQLTIMPLAIPLGSVPSMDGYCTDDAYTSATEISLAPYGDGDRATVRLLRTSDYLWACFNGLRIGVGTPMASVALLVDPDNDRGSAATAGDFGFFVAENGTPLTIRGDGSAGPGGLVAQMGVLGARWSAEMRIERTVLGGWDKLVGMAFAHLNVAYSNNNYWWPYICFLTNPDFWAQTALGNMPVLQSLSPTQATAGGSSFTLTIRGNNFFSGNVAVWNSLSLATTYVNSTTLTAAIDASRIAASGVFPVKVKASAASPVESNSLPFVVSAAAPVIASLSPSGTFYGSPTFQLTVNGSGFRSSDTIYWNQTPLTTTYVSPTQLGAQVTTAMLADGSLIAIAVQAASAEGGTMSNTVLFQIRGIPKLYLPVVVR